MRCSQVLLRAVTGVTIAGFVLASVPQPAAAQNSPQQTLSPQAIQQFLSNPGDLLKQYPDGKGPMIAAVRDLAASDPQTLNALIGLLANANGDQASAIGTALGQVALAAVNTNQAYAEQIQTAVAAAGSGNALVAFSAVVGGNIKLTAATAGGGGGGGGGGESPTGTNSPTGGISGGFPTNLPTVNNVADNFPSSNTSASTPGTPLSTLGTSVSQATP